MTARLSLLAQNKSAIVQHCHNLGLHRLQLEVGRLQREHRQKVPVVGDDDRAASKKVQDVIEDEPVAIDEWVLICIFRRAPLVQYVTDDRALRRVDSRA